MPPTGPILTPEPSRAVPAASSTAFQTAFEEAVESGMVRANRLFKRTDRRDRTREVFVQCRQNIRERLAALTDRSTPEAVQDFCNFVDREIEQRYRHYPAHTSFKEELMRIVRDCRADLQKTIRAAKSEDKLTPDMLRRFKGTLQNAAGAIRGERDIFENGKLDNAAQAALRDALQLDLYDKNEDDLLFIPSEKDAFAIIDVLQKKAGNFCEHIRGPLEQDALTLKGRHMFLRILKRIDDAIIDIQNRVSSARTTKDPDGPLLTISLPPEVLAKLEEGKGEGDERDEINEREISEGLYDTVIEHTLQNPFKDLRVFAATWREGLGTPLFIEQEDFATICRTFQQMINEGRELVKRRIPSPKNKRGIDELCFGNKDESLVNEIQRRWLTIFETLEPLFEKGKPGLFEKMKRAFGQHSYIKLYPIFDYTIRKRGKVPSSLVEGVRSFQMDQSLGVSFLDKRFAYCQDVAAGRKPREEAFEASPADCLFVPEREYLKLWVRDICRVEKIATAEAFGDFCTTTKGNMELEQMADRFNKKNHAGLPVRLGIHLKELAIRAFVPPTAAAVPLSVDAPRPPTPTPAPEPTMLPTSTAPSVAVPAQAGPITVREVKSAAPAPPAPAAPAPKPLAALTSSEKLPADVEVRIAAVLDSEPIKVLEHPEKYGKKYFILIEKMVLARVRILREHRGTLVLSKVLVILGEVEEYIKIQRNKEPSKAYATGKEWEDAVLRPLDHLTQSADGLPEILQPLALGLQNLDERIAAVESEVTRSGNEAAENEAVCSQIEACEREEKQLEADKTAKQGEMKTLTGKLAGVDPTSTEFTEIYGKIGECRTALASLQQRKPEIEARKEKLRRRLKPDVAALHTAKSEELRALLEKKRGIVDQLQRISFES